MAKEYLPKKTDIPARQQSRTKGLYSDNGSSEPFTGLKYHNDYDSSTRVTDTRLSD